MVSIAIAFVAGLAAWTFLEYVIHDWLGHLPRGRILVSREHLAHHADILYFSPLRLKVRGAAPVLGLLLAAAWALFGLAVGLAFVVAVAIGWTAYEGLHQSIHVKGPTNRYSRWAARHHLHHHFARPNRNHGVTTPLWDLLLGTYEPARQVRVRRRHLASIPWLAAAHASGAEFAADYEIV